MATHPSVLAWRIPWTEEPGGLRFRGREESDTPERTALYPGGTTLKAAKALKTPPITAGKGANAQREPCAPPPQAALVSPFQRVSASEADHRFALGPGWFHPAFAGRSSPASITRQGSLPPGRRPPRGPLCLPPTEACEGALAGGRALRAGAPREGSLVGYPAAPPPPRVTFP